MCEGYNNALTMSTPKNGGLWQLLAALKNENSFTQLKLRDARIQPASPESEKRRLMERKAQQEELRRIVMQYNVLPIDEYMNFVVKYYNYDVLE